MSAPFTHRWLLPLAATVLLAPTAGAQRVRAIEPPYAVTVAAGRFDVVLLTHAGAARLDEDSIVAAWFSACGRRIDLPAGDSATVARSRPWDWTTGGTADPATLTLLVSRASATSVTCDSPLEAQGIAAARGYRVTHDTAYPYDANLTAIRLLRGTRGVDVRDHERATLSRLTPRGIVTVAGGLNRISVAMDDLAPDSTGTVRDLVLEVTSPDTAAPRRIPIPWERLRPMWEQVLASRAARSAALAAAGAPHLATLTAPADEPDRVAARTGLGIGFAEAGDLAAARVVLAPALQDEPCLTLHRDAPAAAHDVLRHLARPADRCSANMPLTVLRATLAPGLGHTHNGVRRYYAAHVFAAVAGTLVMSQYSNDRAKEFYARYLAVNGADPLGNAAEAARLYDRAERARMTGTALVVTGTSLWALSIIEAAWSERRQIQRLARVRNVGGRAPRVGLEPCAAPGRVGLAFTFR